VAENTDEAMVARMEGDWSQAVGFVLVRLAGI
jgi:hypothetical protein